VVRSARRFAGGLVGSAGMVERVVEVVGRSSRIQVRPQEVHHLLPVQSVTRRESEQLDEARRVPQMPRVIPDNLRPHRNAEATEQPHTRDVGFSTHRVIAPLSALVANLAYLGAELKHRLHKPYSVGQR
jgi:hypothetical protein